MPRIARAARTVPGSGAPAEGAQAPPEGASTGGAPTPGDGAGADGAPVRREGVDADAAPLRQTVRPSRDRPRVAAVIPAKDEARRIAATVRAVRAVPGVDLVLVVDDGSVDDTQHVARDAGAVVVRHSHNRGRAAAMETGAAVVAMRDLPDRPPRSLLFLAGDLAESAVAVAPLVPPVLVGDADMTVAVLSPTPAPPGRGVVVRAARRAIARLTGWTPTEPLSPLRCLTRDAFEAATPLAHGVGIWPGMTIDLLRAGFRVIEVPCDLRHHSSGNSLRDQARRAFGYRDVELAIGARRARAAADVVRERIPRRDR